MKIISSYLVEEDEKILFRKEEFNNDNQLTKSIEYKNNKVEYTKLFEFDTKGNLLKETEESENGIASIHYQYNDKNERIKSDLFFGTELYESVIYDLADNTLIVDTIREGKLAERFVQKEDELGNGTKVFFDGDGNKEEIQKTKILEDGWIEHQYFDGEETLISIKKEQYDANDLLIQSETYDSNKELEEKHEFVIENENITKQISYSVTNDVQNTVTHNEYDANGNLVKQIINDTQSNRKISQYWCKFNENNDLIEEYINRIGNFDAVTGIMQSNFIALHVYEIEYKD